MKKKSLLALLLALVCLLSVACGKDEKKEEKKEEEKVTTQSLTCDQSEDNQEMSFTMVQDMKTYKLTKATMKTKLLYSSYKGMAKNDDELLKLVCSDEDEEYNDCKARIEDKYLIAEIDYKPDKFMQSIIDNEEEDVDKLDADTLTKLKASAEKDGAKCVISK